MPKQIHPLPKAMVLSSLVIFLLAGLHLWLGLSRSVQIWGGLLGGSLMPLVWLVSADGNETAAAKIMFVVSLLYGFLGIRVWQGSKTALAIALTLSSLDTLWLLVTGVTTGAGEAAFMVLPILFGRLVITFLFAAGLIHINGLSGGNSGQHPILAVFSFCFRAILLALSICLDPLGIVFAWLSSGDNSSRDSKADRKEPQ